MEQSFILLPLPQAPLRNNPALSLSKLELGAELRTYHHMGVSEAAMDTGGSQEAALPGQSCFTESQAAALHK